MLDNVFHGPALISNGLKHAGVFLHNVVVGKVIRLLPTRYALEFAKQRIKLEQPYDARGADLPTEDLWNALFNFIKEEKKKQNARDKDDSDLGVMCG